MKTRIDISNWERKAQYDFFSKFEEPFFGVTVEVDCTTAYQRAKENGRSFFLFYLYRALKAANQVENFRYRIVEDEVYLYDRIHASPTIGRDNGTFGFSYMSFTTNEAAFYANGRQVIEEVRQKNTLIPSGDEENVIHFSALPWLRFTSMSHARMYSRTDSCPKISFGKLTEAGGRKTMPVSIHVHHALVDGFHVGLFLEAFQDLLNAA